MQVQAVTEQTLVGRHGRHGETAKNSVNLSSKLYLKVYKVHNKVCRILTSSNANLR